MDHALQRNLKSKSERNSWATAQEGWLPLAKAIFHFAGVETNDPNVSTSKTRQALNELLTKTSRAPNAEIDWDALKFCIAFPPGPSLRRHPWTIIENVRRAVPSPSGPLPMTELEDLLQRALTAANAVWRDTMLAGFNRAASAGSILLYGRLEKMVSPFIRLPSDIWLQIEVHDWVNGNAKAADGTDIWSIHASVAAKSPKSKLGRKPLYDQDQINGEVVRILKKKGRPTPSGDPGWQAMADLERLVRTFCQRTTGSEPSKSTCQTLVQRALIYCDSRGL